MPAVIMGIVTSVMRVIAVALNNIVIAKVKKNNRPGGIRSSVGILLELCGHARETGHEPNSETVKWR